MTVDTIGAAIIFALFLTLGLGFIYATAHTLAGPAGLTTALAITAYYVWGRYAHHTHN